MWGKVEQINAMLESMESEVDPKTGKQLYVSVQPGTNYAGYDPQAVFDAVNRVIGPHNWRYEVDAMHELGSMAYTAEVTLYIRDDGGEWIKKATEFGDGQSSRKNDADARKSAITDALKKAFGVGMSIGNRAYLGLLGMAPEPSAALTKRQGGRKADSPPPPPHDFHEPPASMAQDTPPAVPEPVAVPPPAPLPPQAEPTRPIGDATKMEIKEAIRAVRMPDGSAFFNEGQRDVLVKQMDDLFHNEMGLPATITKLSEFPAVYNGKDIIDLVREACQRIQQRITPPTDNPLANAENPWNN